MILNNGAKPIASYIDHDPGPGSRDEVGLVLAFYRNNHYVVWSCAKDADEEGWDCEAGDYFDEDQYAAAQTMFGLRLRRRITTNISRGIVQHA